MALRVSLTERISIEARGVVVDEQRFPGRQGRLVFAYLLAAQGRPVPRDELADALWGDGPPARWEKALSVLVSKLRALLNECGIDGSASLTSAFGCYQLTLPAGTWIDVAEADEAATAAERGLAAGDLEAARANASIAESLARRTFLPGEDGRWVGETRAELREILVRALDCLAEANRRSGDPAAAVRAADELIVLEPFRERGYRLLMQAQSAAGNDAEALRTYERCRTLLAEELGAYPSPDTEAVHRELLRAPSPGHGAQASEAAPVPAIEREPETVPVRRLARRTAVGAAALTLALGVAVVSAVLATRGGDSHQTAVMANAVGLIDAESGEILSETSVSGAPREVAVGPDAIWVTNANDNTVSRIDQATNDVRQTVRVGGGPAGVAVTRSAVS